MSLFRKAALDSLSTPEQLDQPLQLLRPTQWVLLTSLSLFSLTILAWSIFGRIPVRISGKGVLIKPNSLTVVQSETSGQITELSVNVGDCIDANSLMARIDPVSQEIEMNAVTTQLAQMRSQDEAQDLLAQQRLSQLQADIERVSHLAQTGALSTDELNRRQRELSQLRYAMESENSRREQQIKEQQNRILSRQEEIERTSLIRAPITGCIVDRGVHQGEVVQPGSTLFTLQREGTGEDLESLVFFPVKDGKRLEQGQRVRVSPTTTKQQRHGGIEGEIVTVRLLPVRDEAIVKRLGVPSLLESVRGAKSDPLIEVSTTLQRDPATHSGYDWGGGADPKITLSAGTTTTVRVLVEERRPISYVIPILRDLTGIY